MESIKNTVSHVLGKSGDKDSTTDQGVGHQTDTTTGQGIGHHTDTATGHHTGITGSSNTAPYDPGNNTGLSGTAGTAGTTGTTGTSSTAPYDSGNNTGLTGTTGASQSTVHDQITTGTGNTAIHGPEDTLTHGAGNTFSQGAGNTLSHGTGDNFSHGAGNTHSHGTGSTLSQGAGTTLSHGTGDNYSPGAGNTFSQGAGNTVLHEAENTLSHGATGTSATTGGESALRRDATDTTSAHHTGDQSSRPAGATDSATGTGHTGTDDSSDINRGRHTTTDDSSHKHHDPHEVQSPDQGPDPALVGDAKEHPKLTGQGAPGSHSAFFGLTPDGKKYEETSSRTTAPVPAHGGKSMSGASGPDSGKDTVSGGHGGVSDQIDAPDRGEKGLERKDPAPLAESNSGGKPGAGLTGLGQGSGQ